MPKGVNGGRLRNRPGSHLAPPTPGARRLLPQGNLTQTAEHARRKGEETLQSRHLRAFPFLSPRFSEVESDGRNPDPSGTLAAGVPLSAR